MAVRQQRMNERIREILSDLVQREVADPRLRRVTITEVRLDPEMVYATVYVNALGDEARQKDVMDGLKRAAGFLRRETGRRVRLRVTPELLFRWDATLAQGEHINRLIDDLDIPAAEQNEAEENDEDELD